MFLAAHVAVLPRTLDDIDSINFALGVRDFDVARHQPHPPGYPVFIGLAKLSTAVLSAAGAEAADVWGLAIWSAIGGAVLVIAVFSFSRSVFGDDERALVATLLTTTTPLWWFSALRPLSDMSGLAAAFVSLAMLMRASIDEAVGWNGRRGWLVVGGAFLATSAVGFRSQAVLLTAPLLALVLIRTRMPAVLRIRAVAAAAIGGLAWGIPLIAANGGPQAYLHALGGQAGEDFAGVTMLWLYPTPRVAVFALINTFVLPWDSPVLAGVVLAGAAAGAILCLRRERAALAILIVVFGPYLVFHLLFQETPFTRYALPLVPMIGMLAAVLLSAATRAATVTAAAGLAAAGLMFGVPAAVAFARTPGPGAALVSEMRLMGSEPIVGMHRRAWSETRRARQWAGGTPGQLLESPRDYEWLEVTRTWLEGRPSDSWFVADPRRTDLALFDGEYRRTREYRWPLNRLAYLGGVRPDELDWHIYSRPGWFLERGWALTPEVAGITERDGWGPHRRPSIGWIRRRTEGALLMIGGRHLGAAGEPAARVTVTIDGRAVTSFDTGPGFFLKFVTLAPGTLAGDGPFAQIAVASAGAQSGAPAPRVALEQFNLQAPDVVQLGFAEGWHEPEYNPRTARLWRWMSESASLQVHHGGGPVMIEIRGESPLRYYDDPPLLKITAGGRTLGELRPDRDFVMTVSADAAALDAAGGRVQLESSAHFVPGDREGTADRRHLALRIYSVQVGRSR
jgi:hypothetical protein